MLINVYIKAMKILDHCIQWLLVLSGHMANVVAQDKPLFAADYLERD